jgi:hypothetical protein
MPSPSICLTRCATSTQKKGSDIGGAPAFLAN